MLPSIFPEGAHPLTPAVLALADGTVFRGVSVGANGSAVAEVVFNTSITGYQEILTDPSYAGQIVTLTYPHIGNTGANDEDVEARRVFAAGLVVRDVPPVASNFRAQRNLSAYLRDEGIVAIAGIDTRKLTRILREKGAQGGCIATGDDVEAALAKARAFPGMAGQDLARTVTTDQQADWRQSVWQLGAGYSQQEDGKFHVVAYDFGVKHNILRLLTERGCRIRKIKSRGRSVEQAAILARLVAKCAAFLRGPQLFSPRVPSARSIHEDNSREGKHASWARLLCAGKMF